MNLAMTTPTVITEGNLRLHSFEHNKSFKHSRCLHYEYTLYKGKAKSHHSNVLAFQ